MLRSLGGYGQNACLLARARKLLRAITVAVDPLAVAMLAANQGCLEKTLTTSSLGLILSFSLPTSLSRAVTRDTETLASGLRRIATVLRLPASNRASWKLRLDALYLPTEAR